LIISIIFHSNSFKVTAAAVILVLSGLFVDANADYEFITSFGDTGTALGAFVSPRGVTVNHAGKIVITESGNHRVQLCDEAGNCTGFGSFGSLSGEFDRPRGVAVNSADRIFIADRGNDRIASCASTGSCTDFGGSGTAIGKFESPRGIAIDSQDQIYIVDTDNNRVQICDDQGACSAFGKFGSAAGEFNSPTGIGIDSQGRIIIADRGNNRIQICTAAGSCSAFGSAGTAPGQFDGPAGIAIDSKDRIIVVDRFNDRVQVCTQQGSCTAFGSFGISAGKFNLPWGVAVDGQDRIIVADLGNDRIQIFAEPAAPPVQISSFSVTPGSIEAGQQVTASWAVSHATSCTALGGTADWQAQSPSIAGGTTEITIANAGSYTFTLQCTDGTNTVTASADVTVTPTGIPINTGLNDAWYYPGTDGQGFFINVLPDLGVVLVSWFTYDTVRPADDVMANLGDPGHRWLLAVGSYSGNEAVMEIEIASGGLFDTPTNIDRVSDGTMVLTFSDCNTGVIEYDILSIDRQGTVPIERVAVDNVPLCEALVEELAVQENTENSVSSVKLPTVDAVEGFSINTGLNDAWYYPGTDGQGFFINVLPDLGVVLVSWFTYDTARPADDVTANLGDPGHRWLLALGSYSGNEAVMEIEIASGGVFDTPTDIDRVSDGTMVLTFSDCNTGVIEYDILSIDRQGTVPIERVAADNIPLCEAFSSQANTK